MALVGIVLGLVAGEAVQRLIINPFRKVLMGFYALISFLMFAVFRFGLSAEDLEGTDPDVLAAAAGILLPVGFLFLTMLTFRTKIGGPVTVVATALIAGYGIRVLQSGVHWGFSLFYAVAAALFGIAAYGYYWADEEAPAAAPTQ